MSRFKTELCNNLIELGTCKYGDRCHYAHGAHELRQVSKRHPKYRTEKCKNFELTGKCPFGPRCSYVHPKPDLDSMIEQLTKYMKHTKAPKPDSEDDDDLSLFTRTDSSISISRDSMNTADDEHNKENLDVVIDYKGKALNLNQNELFKYNCNQQLNPHHSNLRNQQTQPLISRQAHNQIASSSSNLSSNGLNNRTNLTAFEPQNYESLKKTHLMSSDSINSSNTIASSPFGISNPLSDLFNNTDIDGRSPVNPNKQFITRF